MRNKIFVTALILSLIFTLSACGGSGSVSSSEAASEWELTEDGYVMTYDFGAETSEDGALMVTLDKLDYSDFSALQESLQAAAEEGMKNAGLENFEFITDYEALEESIEEAKEEGYEVGDLVYCSGMEEDDMDLAAFESGCYNNPTDGKNYQYSIFSTKSYYGVDNVDTDEIIEIIKTTYGITLDKSKLEKAVKAIGEKAMEPMPEEEASEEAEGEESATEEDGEEVDAEESDSEDMVFVDEDGNEIDLSELELEEGEDLEEDSGYEDDEEYDEEEIELEEGEEDTDVSEDEEDEEFETLTEDEMNDLVFADEEEFEGGYPCVMNQTIENKGEGYSDKIVLSLIAQQVSEEEALIYMSVEIDRCYE